MARMSAVLIKLMQQYAYHGMELLSSVHWVCTQEKNPAQNTDEAIEKIFSWNTHKQKTFKKSHIIKAWHRLAEQNWLSIS